MSGGGVGVETVVIRRRRRSFDAALEASGREWRRSGTGAAAASENGNAPRSELSSLTKGGSENHG